MENIIGIPQDVTRLPPMSKLGDLIYFEGPLLSHVSFSQVAVGGPEFLMKWVDNDEDSNRWMLKQIDDNILWAYFNKQISLRELFTINNYQIVILLDYSDDQKILSSWISELGDIPNSYLPEEDSFFEPDQHESYSLELSKRIISKKQNKIKKAIYEIYQNESDNRYYFRLKSQNGQVSIY